MNFKLFSFAATVTLMACAGVRGETEICSGTLSGYFRKDLKVEECTSCFLDSAVVDGNVQVREGAILEMSDSITKKIDMKKGSQAIITDSFIREHINGDKITKLVITGQTVIGKEVKVKLRPANEANGKFSIFGGNVTIQGKVQVEDSKGGSVSLLDVHIMGEVKIEDSILDSILLVGNNLMDDDFEPEKLEIHKVTVLDRTMTGGEDSQFASTHIEGNFNVKELILDEITSNFDLVVKENEVAKNIEAYKNSFRFAKFLDNCAAKESVTVKKSHGDALTCIGNNLRSHGCHGEQGVYVDDNEVDSYPNDLQCNPCPPTFPPGYEPCGPDCDNETTLPATSELPEVCACQDSCGVCDELEFCFCDRFGDGTVAFCQCLLVPPENECEPGCFNCFCLDEERMICACQDVCNDVSPCIENGGVESEDCRCDYFDGEDLSCRCVDEDSSSSKDP